MGTNKNIMGFYETRVKIHRDDKIVWDDTFLVDDFSDEYQCAISAYCHELEKKGEYKDGIKLIIKCKGTDMPFVTSSKVVTTYCGESEYPYLMKIAHTIDYQEGLEAYVDSSDITKPKIVVMHADKKWQDHFTKQYDTVTFDFW